MYLSRLLLDPRSRAVRRDLADCQELHRTIMSAFPQTQKPEESARERFGVLHRLEVDHRRNRLVLYVQSLEKPDWSNLAPGYLYENPDLENPACKPVGEKYRGFRTGAVFTFRLQANPSRKIDKKNQQDGPRWHGKRVELRREEDQIAWLQRKGQQGGFDLLGVRVLDQAKELGQRRRGGSASPLTLAAVVFEGHLKITDADKFYHHSLALLLLGPGTSITHAAVAALADNGCLVYWVGEGGVRFYSHGQGLTRAADNLLQQARLWADPALSLQVVLRMYRMRFPEPLPGNLTLQQIRGNEGVRVREAYARASRESGVPWQGRAYRRDAWDAFNEQNLLKRIILDLEFVLDLKNKAGIAPGADFDGDQALPGDLWDPEAGRLAGGQNFGDPVSEEEDDGSPDS
jgi:CRISPR-associated protein Cas6/Cse3/CasE subtype I-E